MATFATYTTPNDFLWNSAAAIEVNSLVGINSVLTGGPYAIGATTLTLASATGLPTPPDLPVPSTTTPVEGWILDGLNSEVVQITGVSTSTNTITLASPGLVAAHSAGVSFSTAGTSGNLASLISEASRACDIYCMQGPSGILDRTLFAVSRAETYFSPSLRCHVTSNYTLTMQCWHFPVQSVTSIAIQFGTVPGNAVDISSIVLPEGARRVDIPVLNFTGGISSRGWMPNVGLRSGEMWVKLTYIGGPIVGSDFASVPHDIRRACRLYVQHFLSYRQNPVGAADFHFGDMGINARLRGDTSNRSLLVSDADTLLRPYAAPRGK